MPLVDIHIKDSILTVPDWLFCLQQEQINEVVVLPSHDERIIACGYYPNERQLTFVTLDLKVYEFSPDDFYIPRGDFLPTADGLTLYLPNTNSRWPKEFEGFYAPSKWIISVSKLALQKPSLQLNNKYLGEFIIEDT